MQGEQHEVVLPTGPGNRCQLLWAQEGDLCRVRSSLLNSSQEAIFPLGIAACPDKDYQSLARTEHYTYLISVAVYTVSIFFLKKEGKKQLSSKAKRFYFLYPPLHDAQSFVVPPPAQA